jgi:hypothetical protein
MCRIAGNMLKKLHTFLSAPWQNVLPIPDFKGSEQRWRCIGGAAFSSQMEAKI